MRYVTYDLFKLQFEGSDVLEDKIERFSASLRNHLHWQYNEDEGPFLCSDLSLQISIEVRAQESKKHCSGNLISIILVTYSARGMYVDSTEVSTNLTPDQSRILHWTSHTSCMQH